MKQILIGVAFLLVGTGCDKIQEKLAQKAADKVVEGTTGGEVKVDSTNGGTTVTDKKSGTTVQAGAAAKLPDGWPSAVPVYPGAVLRNAMTTTGGKSITLTTKDPSAKVADFYKKSGLKMETEMNLGPQQMLAFKSGKSTVTVAIGQAPPDTSVTVTVAD